MGERMFVARVSAFISLEQQFEIRRRRWVLSLEKKKWDTLPAFLRDAFWRNTQLQIKIFRSSFGDLKIG